MKKFIDFIKNNLDLLMFVIVSIFIELFAITYTNCNFYLSRPIYPILILVFFVLALYFIKNKVIRFVSSVILSILQIVLDTGLIFLYDSNGTVFEWAMFNQRTDAFGTLERFDFQYGYIGGCLIVLLVFGFFVGRKLYKDYKNQISVRNDYSKRCVIVNLCVILGCLVCVISYPLISISKRKETIYTDRLYSTTSNNYQTIGMVGNAVYQVIGGRTKIDIDDLSDVDEFIYAEKIDKSDYYGVSKDNNLILILIESGEWYPFTLYPELSEKLYPNLTKFMKEGLIATNFYQKEKTDVSEAFSVIGNYPTGKYVNYDFAENSYPYALPSLLKYYNPEMVVRSYHANYGAFYNRYNLHKSWGFESLTGIKEMNSYGVEDTWQHKKGERNLDSITFEKMKEVMFPKSQNFFSFILSFSMHGYYGKRESLKPYYEIMDSLGILEDTSDINDEYLKTYMAAFMDFDKAVGEMMSYLEETGVLDNTTIIMFSDHNTYYNKLSYYAKGIEEKYNSELYHIPMMIYDKKLTSKNVSVNGNNRIEKFTTTSDIVPTVLDIFGLDGWKNLYFGSSVFVHDVESMVFSRNYGIFVSPQIVGYSLNSLMYEDNFTEDARQDFERRALVHLKKLEYIDKIYYSDYFKTHEYMYH